MAVLTDAIGYGAIGSRPAAGSPGRVYFSTEPATYRDNGSSWDDVSDAGTGGGSELLGLTGYAAGSDAALFTQATSSSLADIDATNASVTFTAPASGNVLVKISCLADNTTAGHIVYLGVRESTTDLKKAWAMTSATGATTQRTAAAFLITGTAGGSHTYKAAASGDGTGTVHVYTGPTYGQIVIEVWAAP